MRKDELWGFCEPCESWKCTAHWYPADQGRAACPECGAAPSLIESRDGDRGYITVILRLPPGAVEPVL